MKEQKMVLTEADKKKINAMTGNLYEMADNIRKGHVELNAAREFNITARNIQGQYKILYANEILAQGTEMRAIRLKEAV